MVSEINVCIDNTINSKQAVFKQPHTGGTMDTLNNKSAANMLACDNCGEALLDRGLVIFQETDGLGIWPLRYTTAILVVVAKPVAVYRVENSFAGVATKSLFIPLYS